MAFLSVFVGLPITSLSQKSIFLVFFFAPQLSLSLSLSL